MVGKTNGGWSKMGLGLWSRGSYLCITAAVATLVFFALGCLDPGAGNTLWTDTRAHSLRGN